MDRRSLVALCLLLGLSLAITVCGAAHASEKGKAKNADVKVAKDVITPELDRCTLDAEGHTYKPVRVSSPKLAEHAVRDLRIQTEGATIRAFKVGEDKPQWTAKVPGETRLAWLAADEKIIYFAGYKIDKKSEDFRPESPLCVRRLELASGKWLDELAVDGKPGPKESESIQSSHTSNGRLVVLTVTTDDDKGWEGTGQLVSYRVFCFKAGETRPVWSKTFQSSGKIGRPGAALLLAARSPAKVQPNVQQITWLGQDVLVCAGPIQDLLCLEGGTGKQRWRMERIWEYERGFIGPSVWQHFIARSGGGDDDKKDEKREKDARRPPARQHSIIGGPVVVDVPKDRRGDRSQSIFVAVAKGPSAYGEYLSDCVIYELDSDGKPLAMANLPRMIRGGQYRIQKDGVVWACQSGAFVKVGVSRNRGTGIGMGPGGPDLLCRVDWYRHISPEEPDAWLTATPAGDPVAIGDTFAFRVCAGGYITAQDARVYCFPLSIIDLKTGADQALLLRVPYKGKLPEPETNYSRSQSAGKDRWQTLGPHVLAITWLHIEGERLQVTLGMEEWVRTLEFEIDQLQGRKQK